MFILVYSPMNTKHASLVIKFIVHQFSDVHRLWSSEAVRSSVTILHSDLKELSDSFCNLFNCVVVSFEHFPNGVQKLKETMESLLLPLNGRVIPLIQPMLYSKAETVREFFSMISLLVNPLSFHLLCSLSHLCDCKPAVEATLCYNKFLCSKCDLVLCADQWTCPTDSDGLNDLNTTASCDANAAHIAPLDLLQSPHPLLFTKIPEHDSIPSLQGYIRLSAEIRKKSVSIADYNDIVDAICGFFLIPKCSLTYIGCSEKPLTLCWQMDKELLEYITGVRKYVSSDIMLSELSVVTLIVGDWINYKCLTLKV